MYLLCLLYNYRIFPSCIHSVIVSYQVYLWFNHLGLGYIKARRNNEKNKTHVANRNMTVVSLPYAVI